MNHATNIVWGLFLLTASAQIASFANLLAPQFAVASEDAAEGSSPGQQPAAKWITTRQLGFSIPYTAPAGDPAIEVHLYVSDDRGQSWRLYDRQRPGAVSPQPQQNPAAGMLGGQFDFRANRDGEYWFAPRTVDPRRRYDPPRNMLPELRVLIDTLEPKLDLTVETGAAGELKANWKLFDENLKSETLKLEIQTRPNGPWQPVAIDRSRLAEPLTHVSGEVSLWPKAESSEVLIRAEIRDASDNVTVVNRRHPLAGAKNEVARRQEPAGVPPRASAAPPAAATLPRTTEKEAAPGAGAPATPVSGPTGLGGAATDPFAHRRRSIPGAAPSSETSIERPLRDRSIPWPADTGAAAPKQPSLSEGMQLPPEFPSDQGRKELPKAVENGERMEGERETSLPGGERPRMTTSRRFRLEYDVESVGPSGLGKVELWYTRDRGRSWHSKGYDSDRQSPFDVEVESEGLYGFRILIENGDGLASRMPQPGDAADLWIAVDWSAPTASLTSAIYGVGAKAGQLEIGWRAEDVNLTDRPITLSFSESAAGPWSTIAAGLENAGRYSWKVDPRTPERIYLRLEVRDEAGNVQVDQLREPISIEGLAPKGRIRGFKLEEDVGKEAARKAGRQ